VLDAEANVDLFIQSLFASRVDVGGLQGFRLVAV
jgi:hypothetical protein